MNNTIILIHGTGEIKEKGDAVLGIDNNAAEVKRWTMEQIGEAKAELAKHRCTYHESKTFIGSTVIQADEWALQYCECDEDGEYVTGADYDLAEEA